MTESIVVEYELAAPPERVWRFLTESELLAAWLMPNDLRPEVGHAFTLQAQPTPGWDGVVHGEVLEVVPFERLVYAWRGGSEAIEGYGHRLDTVVTWTLTPGADGGTRLRLEHAGFTPADAFAFRAMSGGWSGPIAERLREAVAAAG